MESADALVLAAPVNNMDVTAVTRAFIERMVGYMHWPFGADAPKLRIERPRKHAVLITSSAMPGWMATAVHEGLGQPEDDGPAHRCQVLRHPVSGALGGGARRGVHAGGEGEGARPGAAPGGWELTCEELRHSVGA